MARTVAQMIPRPFFVTPLLAREIERRVLDGDARRFRKLFGSKGAPLTALNIVKAAEEGLSAWCLLRWVLSRKPPVGENTILKDALAQENAPYRRYRKVACSRGCSRERNVKAWTSYRRAEARTLLSAFRKVARRYKKMGYKTALKLPGTGKAQLAFLGMKP